MPITASALRELHRIHRRLSDLRSRLERGPRQVEAGQRSLAMAEQRFADAKEALTQAQVRSHERQLQLREREQRIADLRGKLNACSTNREYQALKEQIAADEQANSVLSDEILEMLEKIDELQEEVTATESGMQATRQDVDALKQKVDQERGNLESELNRVLAELETAEHGLPGDFLVDYRRITRARGEDALAQIEGETCGACHCMLSPQTMNELYLSKPVFCKSCGALLYLPEDRAPAEP